MRLKGVEEVGHRVPELQGLSAFEFQDVPTARARAVQRAGVLRKHLRRQSRFTHPQHAVGVCGKKLGKGVGLGCHKGQQKMRAVQNDARDWQRAPYLMCST